MVFLSILLVIFIVLVGLNIVRWLWNSTLPGIFGCRQITLWETFKIVLLSVVLFGGMRLPFGYTWSQSRADITTTWSIGSPAK